MSPACTVWKEEPDAEGRHDDHWTAGSITIDCSECKAPSPPRMRHGLRTVKDDPRAFELTPSYLTSV
jgi:hypothetical protein